MMVFFSCPIMSFHDINFNEKVFLVSTRYDKTLLGMCKLGEKVGS
jgi:hypothetical protein